MSYVLRIILAAVIFSLQVFCKVPVGFKSIQHCKEYSKHKYENPDMIIFPGEQPIKMKYPFIVSIYGDKANSNIVCGGVLIDKRFILTSAHCLNGDEATTFVKVGSETGGGDRYNISRRIIHPDKLYYYNDVGLIELEKDVKFSTNVHPICLEVSRNIPVDDWVKILWSTAGDETHNLTTYAIHEVKFDACQDALLRGLTPLGVVDYLQICIEDDREEPNRTIGIKRGVVEVRKDASTQQFVAFGIPSIGIISLGAKGKPLRKLSTRISSYIKWIESVAWPDEPMQGCSKIKFDIEL